MNNFIIIVLVLQTWMSYTQAQYGDMRCKCICPKDPKNKTNNVIVVNNLTNPASCTCENVVKREETFCLKCECKYETRNTLLIKVIVIFVIFSIGILIMYMLAIFVQMKCKKSGDLSVVSDPLQEQLREPVLRRKNRTLSVTSIDRRMTAWQHKVDEQRTRVYGNQAVLN